MIKINVLFSSLLLALGIYAYKATDGASVTALIPAFLGGLTFLLALLGMIPNWTRIMMYAIMIVTLLGLVGSFDGFAPAIRHFAGVEIPRPAAALTKFSMFILCLFYFFSIYFWLFLSKRRQKLPRVIV